MTDLFKTKMLKCPDCAGFMESVSISGLDESFRCFKCGGIWARPKTVNRLFTEELAKWRPTQVDPAILGFGDHMCPTDGVELKLFSGHQVPKDLPVWRCGKCQWWWWPGDSLFKFKPWQEERVQKARAAGVMAGLAAFMLPLVGLVVLISGLGVGLSLVGRRQQAAVPASAGVREFAAVYIGSGEEIVSFRSEASVGGIEYRTVGEEEWNDLPATAVGSLYRVSLKNLAEGGSYEVRILDKEYQFEAR